MSGPIIPKWPSRCTRTEHSFRGCGAVNSAWTSEKAELMPEDRVTYFDDTVLGSGDDLRARFYRPWGGTLEDGTVLCTFYSDDRVTILKRERVAIGMSATPPEDVERKGYVTSWDGNYTELEEDASVYAVFTPAFYVVRFIDWDGTVLSTQEVGYGSSAVPPPDPSRQGWKFTGWDNGYSDIENDTDCTAQYWQPEVSFMNWNQTLIQSGKVPYGTTWESVQKPQDPERQDYVFTGWRGAPSVVTEDVIVTADFIPLYCNVMFIDWDGEVISLQTVPYGTPWSEVETPPDPSRDGYRFVDWGDHPDVVMSNVSLTAKYDEIRPVITFVDWDGAIIGNPVTVSYRTNWKDVSKPVAPERPGYQFNTWGGAPTTVTENVTVTARYKLILNYLKFTAVEAGSSVQLVREYGAPSVSLETTVDEGETWTAYDGSEIVLSGEGDYVFFRASEGGNVTMAVGVDLDYHRYYNNFHLTGKVAASGNVNSLLDRDYEKVTSLPGTYCFAGLFEDSRGSGALVSAPELPATDLTRGCYACMFYKCTSLAEAPELPSTDISSSCYDSMFYGCTSLTKAPTVLPATTNMYTVGDTTYVTTANYSRMFYGCTSLTKSPNIALVSFYIPSQFSTSDERQTPFYQMFYGCSSLMEISFAYAGNMVLDTSPKVYLFREWLAGVHANGIAYCNQRQGGIGHYSGSESTIPSGWSIRPYIPVE